MSYAAKQPGNRPKSDGKPSSYQGLTFARDPDAISWHEVLCLRQAANTSLWALTAWLVISLLVVAFSFALVAFGSVAISNASAVAAAGLASLYFGYLECLKLVECSCYGRRM